MQPKSILVTLLLLLLAACGKPAVPAAPEPNAATSTVVASAATAVGGESVRVVVQLMDGDGEPLARSGLAVAF